MQFLPTEWEILKSLSPGANYMAVWECCDEEGEAAPAGVESEDAGGWGVEEGAEEVDVAAVATADTDVSAMLLCVMKRSRSFMAGRRVMMIFSTWAIKTDAWAK